MNTLQVITQIRTFLDDGRDYFPTLVEVEAAVNEAQQALIRAYHITDQERQLRTLYVNSGQIANGEYIEDVGGYTPIYPKACRFYEYGNNTTILESITGTYIEYPRYINRVPVGYAYNQSMPHDIVYSFSKEMDSGSLKTKIHFNSSNADLRADLWYIKTPSTFNYIEGNEAVSTSQELPSECHIEVCAIAAEILNDMDVNEILRGDIAIPQMGQRLKIETGGGQ